MESHGSWVNNKYVVRIYNTGGIGITKNAKLVSSMSPNNIKSNSMTISGNVTFNVTPNGTTSLAEYEGKTTNSFAYTQDTEAGSSSGVTFNMLKITNE